MSHCFDIAPLMSPLTSLQKAIAMHSSMHSFRTNVFNYWGPFQSVMIIFENLNIQIDLLRVSHSGPFSTPIRRLLTRITEEFLQNE